MFARFLGWSGLALAVTMLAVQLRERMFHVLVALGASAAASSGCGGKSVGSLQPLDGKRDAAIAHHPDAGHPAVRDGSAGPPQDAAADASHDAAIPVCEHTQQLACGSYDPRPADCVCDPNAPLSENDCTNRRFECAAYDPPTGCECVYITGPK